jgi:hypothetical protein
MYLHLLVDVVKKKYIATKWWEGINNVNVLNTAGIKLPDNLCISAAATTAFVERLKDPAIVKPGNGDQSFFVNVDPNGVISVKNDRPGSVVYPQSGAFLFWAQVVVGECRHELHHERLGFDLGSFAAAYAKAQDLMGKVFVVHNSELKALDGKNLIAHFGLGFEDEGSV